MNKVIPVIVICFVVVMGVGLFVLTSSPDNVETLQMEKEVSLVIETEKTVRIIPRNPNVIYYSIDEIPSSSNPTDLKELVVESIQQWESWNKVNSNLKFELVDITEEKQIQFSWVEEINLKEGIYRKIANSHIQGGFTRITIDIVDKNCEGNDIFYTEKSLKSMMKHEIGHALGLKHSSDKTQLMYSVYDGVEFPSGNYNIPPREVLNYSYIDDETRGCNT